MVGRALQLNAILPPATAVELNTGAGRVCTVISSRPNAPGELPKANWTVPLLPTEETMYCRFVQPNASAFVVAKSVEPFHLAAKRFGVVLPFWSATLVSQNETRYRCPATVGTVCDNVPMVGQLPR